MVDRTHVADFDVKEIKKLIKSLPKSKAPGVSSLSNEYLGMMVDKQDCLEIFKQTFDTLLNEPWKVKEIPQLYTFKLQFIPKASGGIRPICIQESLLNVLHKLIL